MGAFETREPKGGVRTHARPDSRAVDEPISIRPVRSSELGELAALFAPALEPYRGAGSDWILDAYLAELLDVRRRFDEAEVLVAEHEGRFAGTIAFYADVRLEGWSNLPAGWAGFRALAVHPRMRGAGIGTALLRRCVERARDVGAETLGLHTISLLTDAVRLYERLGFVRCPEFDLRASDIFPSENADDMTGLAFRLDVTGAPASADAEAIGPRVPAPDPHRPLGRGGKEG
jgi:GNAT superfamily N-acetyltransferase